LNRFLPLIEESGIRPILAVVPENMDLELDRSELDPEFWSRMRTMEAAGATIGLHGYRHLCYSQGRSLVPLHRNTEFAGVPEDTQRKWIRAGLAILRDHGLNPRIWVAPRHGFDRATLRALRAEGISLLSDGFARVPFKRGGVIWIPQQLWAPMEKRSGLWTICIHSNTARNSLIDQLNVFVRAHVAQLTSVDRVVDEFKPQRLGLIERAYEAIALWQVQARRKRRKRTKKS